MCRSFSVSPITLFLRPHFGCKSTHSALSASRPEWMHRGFHVCPLLDHILSMPTVSTDELCDLWDLNESAENSLYNLSMTIFWVSLPYQLDELFVSREASTNMYRFSHSHIWKAFTRPSSKYAYHINLISKVSWETWTKVQRLPLCQWWTAFTRPTSQ